MFNRRSAIALAAALPLPALAQGVPFWRPTRPIRLIVPFAPGGSNDIVGRIVAEAASPLLGQPIVIENRAGAGSTIGAEAAARSAPDGYTLLINSAQSAVPAVVARVPYDTIRDFAGIAVAGFSPHVIAVSQHMPATNAAELLQALREQPGRFNCASAGRGSGVHAAEELFRAVSRTQFEIVHYRGGGPLIAALLSGEAQFATPTMASSIAQVRAGSLKAVGVASARRTPVLPDVPSAPEIGLPGMVFEEFFPILAPVQTPRNVLDSLAYAFRQAVQQSAPRLAEMAGVIPRSGYGTSAQVMALVQESVQQYGEVLRAAGVQPE